MGLFVVGFPSCSGVLLATYLDDEIVQLKSRLAQLEAEREELSENHSQNASYNEGLQYPASTYRMA